MSKITEQIVIEGNVVRRIRVEEDAIVPIADFYAEIIRSKSFLSNIIPKSCICVGQKNNISFFVLEQIPGVRELNYCPLPGNRPIEEHIKTINKFATSNKIEPLPSFNLNLNIYLPWLYYIVITNLSHVIDTVILYSLERIKSIAQESLKPALFFPNMPGGSGQICFGNNKISLKNNTIENVLDTVPMLFLTSRFNTDAYSDQYFHNKYWEYATKERNKYLMHMRRVIEEGCQKDSKGLDKLTESFISIFSSLNDFSFVFPGICTLSMEDRDWIKNYPLRNFPANWSLQYIILERLRDVE